MDKTFYYRISVSLTLVTLIFLSHPLMADDEDILINDFESEDYGEWKAEGEAKEAE